MIAASLVGILLANPADAFAGLGAPRTRAATGAGAGESSRGPRRARETAGADGDRIGFAPLS